MIFDRVLAIGLGGLVLVLAIALVWQTVSLREMKAENLALVDSARALELAREKSAREEEVKIAAKEQLHTKDSQENTDAFVQSEPARATAIVIDLDRGKRLRFDQARRDSTNRAIASSLTTTLADTADRLITLDRQLVEGVEVVGRLREDLSRRDAEVVLLHGQVMADGKLLGR